jgi:pyruvate-ferredoxin/flavodoxin oxidoreductase
MGAIALAEGALAERVYVATDEPLALPEVNVFGDAVVATRGQAILLGPQLADAAAAGKRATLVAHARDLAGLREVFRGIHARRLGTVVHVLADAGPGDALPLADLGWGVLIAAGVEEQLDLALVARRAAEDCGTPFFVVHDRGSARVVEALAPPSRELVEVFVGAPATRVRAIGDAAHPIHAKVSERVFAERVPFALGSAMRELESLTGRRRDVIERIPAGDAAATIIAMGELGESVIAGVSRLRMQNQDVGAVKLVALRPFPGPRLVKAMVRSDVITVLETTDEPLAQSSPLAREVKAAFADAITWAPDYPGIGRVPRILSGVVGRAEGGQHHELEAGDLDAVLHNMLAGERGRRSFVLGSPDFPGADPQTVTRASPATLAMRGRVRDAATAEACAQLCAAVVSSTLGLRVHASVRRATAAEGGGFAFDLLAARDRPRGGHAPHAVKLVALEDAGMLGQGNPLSRLGDEGVLAVPSDERSADAVWAEIPAYAKAIVFDRGGRVVGWAKGPDDGDERARPWLVAAAFAGLALASGGGGRAAVDASLVAREVADALRVAVGPSNEAWVARGAEAARRAFEAHVEVPRATVERDQESIRLGRRDARASVPPR